MRTEPTPWNDTGHNVGALPQLLGAWGEAVRSVLLLTLPFGHPKQIPRERLLPLLDKCTPKTSLEGEGGLK